MSRTLKERLKDCDEHDSRSIKLYEFISELDFNEADDAFGFKSGGDGDNGEHLMYLIDCYFATKDDRGGAFREEDEAE
jgi:hypothetical protein